MTGNASVAYLHPGDVRQEFMDSMIGLFMTDLTGKQRIVSHSWGEIAKKCGGGGIVDGRNDIAAKFLSTGVEWLFMVDADMSFRPDAMERLIQAADSERRPVMGGLAFAHKSDGTTSSGQVRYRPCPTIYDYFEDDERAGFVPRFNYDRNSVQLSAATGAAIILIHRTSLEKVADKFGPVWFDMIRYKGAHFNEDMAFCVRLSACDIPIHVHSGVRTGHHKGDITHDETSYDQWRLDNPQDDTVGAEPEKEKVSV